MTRLSVIFLTFAFIFTCLTGHSQTVKTIDTLESQHQACLDKGEFMLGCSERFYFQMDSLLNVIYNKLRAKCDSTQKANLREDQLKWLTVRDKQFKYNRQQVHKEAKESGMEGGQDEAMILTYKNALFVRDRVITLIGKTPESYSADKYKSDIYKITAE